MSQTRRLRPVPACFDRRVRQHLLLDVEVKLLDVGRAIALIDRYYVRRSGRSSQRNRQRGIRAQKIEVQRRIVRQIADVFERELIEIDAVPTAHRGLSIAEQIPRESDARSKVIVVALIPWIGGARELPGSQIEHTQEIPLVVRHGVELI